jgi:hypothetical protein
MVFLAPKTLLYPTSTERKNFFPTLMILQMVRNECVRFGGYMEVQVSYKILYLEIPKKAPIFLAFKRGYFKAALDST